MLRRRFANPQGREDTSARRGHHRTPPGVNSSNRRPDTAAQFWAGARRTHLDQRARVTARTFGTCERDSRSRRVNKEPRLRPGGEPEWCGDMAEIPTEGKLYLATVLDLFSRKLLASPT